MQRILVVHCLVRIEVEPPLSAFIGRTRIPGNVEDLEAAVGKLGEVLLERLDPERVCDLVLGEHTVRAVRPHPIDAVADEELTGDSVVGELRVVEIAADRGRTRDGHRQVMVRAPPEFGFVHVARGAEFAADIVGFGRDGIFACRKRHTARATRRLFVGAAGKQDRRQHGHRWERLSSHDRWNAGCAGRRHISGRFESERRTLTSLEEIVDVAGNADPGNQISDLGTGCRELDYDSDDDQDEADNSQVQGQTPGPLPAGLLRRPSQSLLHHQRF